MNAEEFRRSITVTDLPDGRIGVAAPGCFTLTFKDFDCFVAFLHPCAKFAMDKNNPARGIPSTVQEAFISQEIIEEEK